MITYTAIIIREAIRIRAGIMIEVAMHTLASVIPAVNRVIGAARSW
jgi:hypothetical protein